MFGWKKRQEQEVVVSVAQDADVGQVDGEQEQGGAYDCAWCLAEMGIAPLSGSHGICTFHSEQMIASSRQRKARRQSF